MEQFTFDFNKYMEEQNQLYDYLEEKYGGNKIFNLNELLPDRETFKKMYHDIYHILEEGFEIEKIRKFPIKITFDNKEYLTLELRHLLTNMIFLNAFVELGVYVELNTNHLIDAKKINNKLIANYINNNIIIPYRDEFTETEEKFIELNEIIHNIIYRLNKIPRDFNVLMGSTINLEDSFIKLANENERFNEIIHTKIPEGMQPKEIENYLEGLIYEEVNIMKDNENCLQDVLISGTGIKIDQLRECSISGGLKSDLLGNTITIPVNSNFIVGGLNNIKDYYLDAQASRKPLIANKEKMGDSGHMSLLLKLSSAGIYINNEQDCHTHHTVKLYVKNEKFLKKLVGRYYRLEGQRQFKLIKSTDVSLIGRTILLRDPSKCASKEGVCHTCYGAMSRINQYMDVGLLGSTIVTRPLGQNILSTKHIMTTNSQLISFNPIFNMFFKLDANQIRLPHDTESDMELKYFVLQLDNIIKLDELSDNEKFNKFIQYIKIIDIRDGKEYQIVEDEGKELFIHPDLDDIIKSLEYNEEGIYNIPLDELNDIYLFSINIQNNEMTKPLKDTDNLLKGSYFKNIFITVDEMEQKFIELMIESGIEINSIHAAIMLRNLVRDKKDFLKRPDFRKIFVDYVVLGYPASLEYNPAITTSLAYDYLKKQLGSYTTFKKNSRGPLDLLFKKSLS